MGRDDEVREIIEENHRRLAAVCAPFDPITGEGSVGERFALVLDDYPVRVQYLPVAMRDIPLVRRLGGCGSVGRLLEELGSTLRTRSSDRAKLIGQFVRLRCLHDFPFWAALFVYIKNKGGGEDVLFRLTRPQRRFVELLESFRTSGRPIRVVLLKARQWGGSTTSQIYMAWLQLVHRLGLNSLIIAHQGSASDEIKDMFDRMISRYPVEMLHSVGEAYSASEAKMVGVGRSGSIYRVPRRGCKIKIGTAERPEGCRGGDYNLVHLSEVGLWRVTEGRRPEDIVRSACSGVLFKEYTMIVYESTAGGTGNFFHREYDDAKCGRSQFSAMFVSWFDIEQYSLPLDDEYGMALTLWERRDSDVESSARVESGRYLWWLWNKGATLEAINWYIHERAKYTDHGQIASEFPSDDIEAFVQSGARVFDRYKVEALRVSVRPPRFTGEVVSDSDEGRGALSGLHFVEDGAGLFSVWELPEVFPDGVVSDRYLTVVDIGGRGTHSDYSVVVVFDRLFMSDGGRPAVVAQWYGHTDIDLLAWTAARIAAFYLNSLLVIESNTLETHDRTRDVEGDQSGFILSRIREVYPNLYARRQSEDEIRRGLPRRYGFHTNVATKPMIISTLVKVIREGLYTERDGRCLDEYLCYEKKPNGSYGAVVGRHDDLLMTRAIALHICFSEMPLPRFIPCEGSRSPRRGVLSEATM